MSKQERITPADLSADGLRDRLNSWRPYSGAGIHVAHFAADFRSATVELTLHDYNQNYFGTHFGGSLSSMTNPFYVLMLANILGPNYVVWDTAQKIRYLTPGRGTVRATFELTEEQIAEARERTAVGAKYEPVYTVDIVGEDGKVVATVEQMLYIRRNREAGSASGC